MHSFHKYGFFGYALVVGLALAGACVSKAASPYAVTATNVTMAASGSGITNFTVTGIPMTGTLIMSCVYSGPSTTARLPICGGGPVDSMQVTAGQTVTGTIGFTPYGVPFPVAAPAAAGRTNAAWPIKTVMLAGFLLGMSFLGRNSRPNVSALLAAAGVAGLLSIGACGGNAGSTTPGTYTYTIAAVNENGGSPPLSAQTTTTITVTVH